MVNQPAKFAGELAEQSAPIRDLLRNDRVCSWDVVHQMAFDHIKENRRVGTRAGDLRSSQADTGLRRQLIAWI
jgi:hypothetical protein